MQKTRYLIFIYLAKAYEMLDRERNLKLLEGYGLGRRACLLLRKFWVTQMVVAHQCGYHSDVFEARRGVTQGDVPSPTIFNVVVDAVCRAGAAEESDSMAMLTDGGNVISEFVSIFYADDGLLGSE
jgi:hypothetical protein